MRFQFTRLAGEEFAREAELAVDGCQAGFQLCDVNGSSLGRSPELGALAADTLARKMPCEDDEQGRDRPGDDRLAPPGQVHSGEARQPAGHHEQRRPPDQCQHGKGGRDGAGEHGHIRAVFVCIVRVVGGRWLVLHAFRARRRIAACHSAILLDCPDRRTPAHAFPPTMFPSRLNPTLTAPCLDAAPWLLKMPPLPPRSPLPQETILR